MKKTSLQSPQQNFKLRRALVLRKRDKTDTVSVGALSSNLSTYSAGDISDTSAPISLRNQQSIMSAGASTTKSSQSRKRRREFLDLDGGKESELVRFVLDTQGKLETRESSQPPLKDQTCCDHFSSNSQSSAAFSKEPLFERSVSSLSGAQASRSVHRYPTDQKDQFGLQKRRLVEDFEGLNLGTQARQSLGNQRSSPSKANTATGKDRKLIQVLHSVDFDSSQPQQTESNKSQLSSKSSSQKSPRSLRRRGRGDLNAQNQNGLRSSVKLSEDEDIESMSSNDSLCQDCQSLENLGKEAYSKSPDLVWNQMSWDRAEEALKSCSSCATRQRNKTRPNKSTDSTAEGQPGGKRGYLRLEIADKEIREQVNREYLGHTRGFFLDKAHKHHSSMTDDSPMYHQASQSGRSRSLNASMSGVSQGIATNVSSSFASNFSSGESASSYLSDVCNYEIELRDRVLSSKRVLLRNFFSFYIKSLMMVNEKLNISYLEKLKKDYMQLKDADKLCVSELRETIDEMDVDEQSKAHLYQVIAEQTNLRDLLMTDEETQGGETCLDTARIIQNRRINTLAYTEAGGADLSMPSPTEATQSNNLYNTEVSLQQRTEMMDDIYMDVVE